MSGPRCQKCIGLLKELSPVGRKISRPITTVQPEPQGKGTYPMALEFKEGFPEEAVTEERGSYAGVWTRAERWGRE